MQDRTSTEENAVDRLLRERLSGRSDVAFAYLFGSEAKGEAGPESDVDVAVHLDTDRERVFYGERDPAGDGEAASASVRRKEAALQIEGELERELGRRVQVVVLEDAPLGLAHNVLSTGRLVFCRDDGPRQRFFVDHCKRYFEMEHARRIFDRYRRRRLEDGTFGGRERNGS